MSSSVSSPKVNKMAPKKSAAASEPATPVATAVPATKKSTKAAPVPAASETPAVAAPASEVDARGADVVLGSLQESLRFPYLDVSKRQVTEEELFFQPR